MCSCVSRPVLLLLYLACVRTLLVAGGCCCAGKETGHPPPPFPGLGADQLPSHRCPSLSHVYICVRRAARVPHVCCGWGTYLPQGALTRSRPAGPSTNTQTLVHVYMCTPGLLAGSRAARGVRRAPEHAPPWLMTRLRNFSLQRARGHAGSRAVLCSHRGCVAVACKVGFLDRTANETDLRGRSVVYAEWASLLMSAPH